MITAVPEPGSLQSYAREAGVFSLGTSYLILYAPVYGGFMWLELIVARGLLETLVPGGAARDLALCRAAARGRPEPAGRARSPARCSRLLVVITLVGDIAARGLRHRS